MDSMEKNKLNIKKVFGDATVVNYKFGLAYIGEIKDDEVVLYYEDEEYKFPISDVLVNGVFYKKVS